MTNKIIKIGIIAYTLYIAWLISFFLLSCNNSYLKNQDAHIEVGKYYLYSSDWYNEDPFAKIEIDTVKVISIKGNFVQWQYNDGLRLSSELKFFKHNQKPCN